MIVFAQPPSGCGLLEIVVRAAPLGRMLEDAMRSLGGRMSSSRHTTLRITGTPLMVFLVRTRMAEAAEQRESAT